MQAEFTSVLLNDLARTIENGEQAIIFQNRRGYSPYITCEDCAWIPKCEYCAVSLTYHLYKEELRCHYCGYKQRLPINCEACGSTNIKTISYGTEKLEEDLKLIFHHAIIHRMDLDTTRRKQSYSRIISDFETGKIDILVGTQMVSKGLDFDNVSLVGIFDIDRMLHFPDFRSVERTFQLTTQVSGRAGRREKTGKVVIQTTNPSQKIIDKIVKHDYQSFYEDEIKERQKYKYPPFVRLIKLIVKNPDKDLSQRSANKLAVLLKQQLGEHRILGPQEPVINKIRNMFLMDIFIKLERDKINLKMVKSITKEQISLLLTGKKFKKSQVVIDVDPV
jgi:primosomal protein N' (replication factor Y)